MFSGQLFSILVMPFPQDWRTTIHQSVDLRAFHAWWHTFCVSKTVRATFWLTVVSQSRGDCSIMWENFTFLTVSLLFEIFIVLPSSTTRETRNSSWSLCLTDVGCAGQKVKKGLKIGKLLKKGEKNAQKRKISLKKCLKKRICSKKNT